MNFNEYLTAFDADKYASDPFAAPKPQSVNLDEQLQKPEQVRPQMAKQRSSVSQSCGAVG
jgi:hypothetical protein